MATREMHNNKEYALSVLTSIWPELEHKLDQIYLINCQHTNGFSNKPIVKIAATIIESGKKHIVFDHCPEAVCIPIIHHINDIYKKCNDPSIQFYYWTGAITGQQDYDKLCEAYNLKKNINILSSYLFERGSANNTVYDKPYTPGLREKKFLCFNRVERLHRVELLNHMLKLDLIKDSFYSFDFTVKSSLDELEYLNRHEPGKYDLLLANLDMLPLTINRTPSQTNPVQIWTEDYPYFENSYLSIVTETLFYKQLDRSPVRYMHTPNTVRGVFPSEKIYKPIAMRHPFIVVAAPGFLQSLRDRGYRTFSPMIDETYDTIDDDEERMLAIVNEIERLGKWSDVEWQDFTNQVKDIVEHNAQHLHSLTDFRVTKNIDELFK